MSSRACSAQRSAPAASNSAQRRLERVARRLLLLAAAGDLALREQRAGALERRVGLRPARCSVSAYAAGRSPRAASSSARQRWRSACCASRVSAVQQRLRAIELADPDQRLDGGDQHERERLAVGERRHGRLERGPRRGGVAGRQLDHADRAGHPQHRVAGLEARADLARLGRGGARGLHVAAVGHDQRALGDRPRAVELAAGQRGVDLGLVGQLARRVEVAGSELERRDPAQQVGEIALVARLARRPPQRGQLRAGLVVAAGPQLQAGGDRARLQVQRHGAIPALERDRAVDHRPVDPAAEQEVDHRAARERLREQRRVVGALGERERAVGVRVGGGRRCRCGCSGRR